MSIDKIAFSDDSPYYRIGNQVHDHEARIRLLERDSADTKKTLDNMSDTLETFAKEFNCKFNESINNIQADLKKHETHELQNQTKIMGYLIVTLLSVLGSGAYIILQSLLKIP